MSAAPDSVAFQQKRRHTRISAIAGSVFCLFFLLIALAAPDFARWFCLGLAGLSAIAAWLGFTAMRDKRPLLIVDDLGLTYPNFSPQRVPWAEIEAVAVVRTHRQQVRWTKRSYVHQRQSDTINFSVPNLSRYPGGPGRMLSRKMYQLAKLPTIAIQTWFLEATTEEAAEAIRAHWRGEVRVIDIKTR